MSLSDQIGRPVESAGGFQIGRVFSRLFGVVGRNAAMFLGMTALLLSPLLLVMLGVSVGVISLALSSFVERAASVIGTYLLQAALVHATITDLNGERPRFGACLSTAASSFWPIVGISIISGIGISFGLFLLLVPGLVLAVQWAVAVPVRVVERSGVWDSLERSKLLGEGYRWPIFWLLAIYGGIWLAGVMPQLLFISAMAARGLGESSAAYQAMDWARQCAMSIIAAAGAASIYYELRLVKEGMEAEQLAAAFD